MARERRPAFDAHAFLAKLGKGRSIEKPRANAIVYSQGDPASAVYYIQSGQMKATVISKFGKEAIVALMGRHEFFGEACLAAANLRKATVTALTDCVIMRIEKAAIVRVLADEPTFSKMFITQLLSRNLRIEADVVDLLFNSSEKRLARTLLLLGNFGKEGKQERILAHITQATLADMIGTTRSRVNFFMNKFRKLGYISYNGRIEVNTSLLNAVLHDNPQIEN